MKRLRSALCLAVVVTAVAAGPAAAEPLARWSLDEGSGQFVTDAVGSGQHGRLGATSGPDGNDPSWVSGRFGGALRFVGEQNQYVELTDAGALQPPQVTVGAWVRRAGTPGAWRYVLSNGAAACAFASYGLYTGFGGGLAFYVSDADHFVRTPEAAQAAVWDGSWHHAVGTYDGQRVRLFVDGVEVGNGTATTLEIAYGGASARAFIGTYRGSCERPFTGDIDEVAVSATAAHPEQIAGDAARDAARPLPPQTPAVSGPPAVGVPKVASRCVSIRATPKRFVVGRRTRLSVSVRRRGKPLVGKRLGIRASGVKRSVRTGRRGKVRLYVRVKRRGHLQVRASGQPRRCAKRLAVKRARHSTRRAQGAPRARR